MIFVQLPVLSKRRTTLQVTTMTTKINEVFAIREGEWQVRLGGEILSAIFNSRGAALAGLKVEMRRRGLHELSRDCWCSPDIYSSAIERAHGIGKESSDDT